MEKPIKEFCKTETQRPEKQNKEEIGGNTCV